MNRSQLHSLQGPNKEPFEALYADPRFVGLLMYLRKKGPRAKSTEPHGMIQDSGRMDLFLELMELIDDAQFPPAPQIESSRPVAYSAPRHSENNQP